MRKKTPEVLSLFCERVAEFILLTLVAVKTSAMKKILIALLFLLANIEITFAATGYRTGDNVVIWGPVLLIAIIWSGYVVGAKLKERKKREAERIMNQHIAENSSSK